MGFIKILRWRTGGSGPRLQGGSKPQKVEDIQRAAVLLHILGEDHAKVLLAALTPVEKHRLIKEANRIQQFSEALGQEVLEQFLEGSQEEELPSYVTPDDLEGMARSLVRSKTEFMAERVRELWLDEIKKAGFVPLDEEALTELAYEDLGPSQKAAVFMMWLPPELSAMVLQCFPSRLVHLVTGILVDLPFVSPEAKEKVLAEFMEGVSLGIPGLSVGDVGLPVVVEAYVRSDPNSVAQRLETLWLPESEVVVPEPPPEIAPKDSLSPMEKTAAFFQSLSLPLAYKLLGEFTEVEVRKILSTIEQLDGVDVENRKRILEELMIACDPSLERGGQPVQVLGKAMACMIREDSSQVAHKIREHWMSE